MQIMIMRISRRNFCDVITTINAIMPIPMHGLPVSPQSQMLRRRVWPGGGGCAFPTDPASDPRSCPALWLPISAPDVVVVETADIAAFPLPENCKLLAEVVDATEHHLVAALGCARVRFCLRRAHLRSPDCLVIMRDSIAAIRLTAASRFERVMRDSRIENNRAIAPSTYRRARIVRLLAIQDGLDTGASAHDIAFGLIFRRQRPLVGATWKGSSERRHTLRLIAETRRMVDRGYRRLLHHI
jgi:hypothetical protein